MPQHTDHAGVMWHGSYLNWLEEARVKALSEIGLPYKDLSEQGFEMPVVSLEIKYLKTLLHGDEVILRSWSFPRKGVRWHWHTKFLKKGNELVAEAKVDLVLIKKVDGNHHLIRNIPPSLNKLLMKLHNPSN